MLIVTMLFLREDRRAERALAQRRCALNIHPYMKMTNSSVLAAKSYLPIL